MSKELFGRLAGACVAAVAVLPVRSQQVAPLLAVAVGFRERGKVDVAADAELRLEFTGTNRIDRLSLGGVPVSGIVSAATHPEYITGDGALEILPKGTILLFR